MISEFQELSDKIDRLAEMALTLRRENADLRQTNALLRTENEAYMECMAEAQRRIELLLSVLPGLDIDTAAGTPDDEATR